jgi:cellulose synthase/poly-beta-1,6-N-acetylglucosamine synthase-like glycosyltransferase
MLLNGITGRAVHLYREPYMRSGSPIALRDVASIARVSEAGYKIAGMDVVPKDWEDVSGEELAAETIRQVESGGSVILLHDGGGEQHRTAEALPIIISELRARGYEFVLLADLLGLPRDALMPEAGTVKSAFSRLSFRAFGGGWSMLEAAFWTVLLVGFVRAMLSLLLAVLRRRHEVPEPSAWPTVTVVIPAYNEASVIGRCIESTLASDYPNFEVIVVDDGSTDGTWRAAELYQASGQVRLFRQANGGKASALNLALDETESEIVVGIDADSCVHPQALRRLARHFEDPEVGAVAGRVLVGNRERLLTKLQSLEYVVAQGVDRRAKEFLNGIPVVPGAIGAWRANAVLEAGIYSDETLTEDADLTMAIIRTGYRVVYEEDAIATTEAPATVRNLLLQRLRWSLGMMQASWKHRRAVREGRGLGLLTLPEIAIFGYLLPLLAPLADLFLLLVAYDWASEALGLRQAVPLDLPHHALLAYLALPAAEIAVIFAAFAFDRQEDRRLLWLIPLQRLLYRPLLYVSVIRALWRASTGTLAKWASVTRQGHTYDLARIA